MIHLDSMLDAEQCRKWMSLPKSTFDEKVAQRKIVPLAFGPQTFRFNPRIIIAKAAHDAGVPLSVIAASFGFDPETIKRK